MFWCRPILLMHGAFVFLWYRLKSSLAPLAWGYCRSQVIFPQCADPGNVGFEDYLHGGARPTEHQEDLTNQCRLMLATGNVEGEYEKINKPASRVAHQLPFLT
jgi:hypothetical protein